MTTQGFIYHFLRRTLRDHIAIAQIVDFDVLYKVAVRHVHLAVDSVDGRGIFAGI